MKLGHLKKVAGKSQSSKKRVKHVKLKYDGVWLLLVTMSQV